MILAIPLQNNPNDPLTSAVLQMDRRLEPQTLPGKAFHGRTPKTKINNGKLHRVRGPHGDPPTHTQFFLSSLIILAVNLDLANNQDPIFQNFM